MLLQWGHRLSAVETSLTSFRWKRLPKLQWGHRLSAVETIPRGQRRQALHLRASMGPPPFGSGNDSSGSAAPSSTPTGFNGATAFRQWKRRPPCVLHRPGNEASMGPPPFGSGNLYCCQRPHSPRQCFNGATAFRQWKRIWRWPSSTVTTRFNGATAFRQWKLTNPSMPGIIHVWLQWGHRLSAVETAICALTRISTCGIVRLPPQIPLGPVAGSSQLNTHFVVCSRSVARGVTGHLHHWTSRKTPAYLPPIILSPPPCGAVRGRFPG